MKYKRKKIRREGDEGNTQVKDILEKGNVNLL